MYDVQRYYIPTARELARLSQIQRAPILHHFAESLSGASSIRAYGQTHRFWKRIFSLVDNHSRPWFHNISSMEWLSFRLNMLSNFVFAFSLTLLVSFPDGFINPSTHEDTYMVFAIIETFLSLFGINKTNILCLQALLG